MSSELPAAKDEEIALLGCLLTLPDEPEVAKVLKQVSQKDFAIAAHKAIFLAVDTLAKSNSEINELAVKKWLQKRELLDSVGGFPYITAIAGSYFTPRQIDYYVDEIKAKTRQRELMRLVSKLLDDGNPESIIRQIAELQPVDDPEEKEKKKRVVRLPAEVNSEVDLLTETNAADRFVLKHQENVRWTGDHWYLWDGKRWKQDESGEVRELAKQTNGRIVTDLWEAITEKDSLRRFQNKMLGRRGLDNTLELAKARLFFSRTKFDTNHWLLNFNNGAVELNMFDSAKEYNEQFGKRRDHRREDNCTKLLDYDFDPDAKCPEWDAFMRMIFNKSDELVAYVMRAVGYSLTGVTSEQCFFFCYGEGRNGKTTFLETILDCVGSYGKTADKLLIMEKGQQTKHGNPIQVLGVRYLPVGEVNDKDKIDETALKNCTGEDTLTGSNVFENMITFKSTAKVWLRGNEKPRVRATFSVFRRVHCIPFLVEASDAQVAKYDGKIGDVLRRERQGIMAKAVQACAEWQALGKLMPPPEVAAATEEYRKEMDFFAQAIEEVCEIDKDKTESSLRSCSFKDLQQALNRWAKDNEYHPWNRHRLIKDLKAHKFSGPKLRHGYPHYFGLSIRADWLPSQQLRYYR
jgi:putative DNA primase/helicase